MKVTPETLTDDQIRGSTADIDDIEHAIAVDPNWPGGRAYWSREHRAARRRVCDAINARAEADAAVLP